MTHEELVCSLFTSRNGKILIPGLNWHFAVTELPPRLLGCALTQGSTERGFGLYTKSSVMSLWTTVVSGTCPSAHSEQWLHPPNTAGADLWRG